MVSAQNRERFYVTNFGDIEQPKDRGILLCDVLESGKDLSCREKSYVLTCTYAGAVPRNTLERNQRTMVAEPADSESCCNSIYSVKNGLITIKDKQYPVKLADGYYLIRKLTPTECERLQTMPDGYTAAVSNSQRYKALGNGWTAEVIIHILSHALKDIPRDKELVVLSMYDGIATGRYCLDKMGFTNVKYYAYEIDSYAIKIAMSNYPDIVQCGDAFQIRNF